MSAQAVVEDLDLVTVGVLDALNAGGLHDPRSVRQVSCPISGRGDRSVDKAAIVQVGTHRARVLRNLIITTKQKVQASGKRRVINWPQLMYGAVGHDEHHLVPLVIRQ